MKRIDTNASRSKELAQTIVMCKDYCLEARELAMLADIAVSLAMMVDIMADEHNAKVDAEEKKGE